jgi:hypothetical protein
MTLLIEHGHRTNIRHSGARAQPASPEPITAILSGKHATETLQLALSGWRLWVPGSTLRVAPE